MNTRVTDAVRKSTAAQEARTAARAARHARKHAARVAGRTDVHAERARGSALTAERNARLAFEYAREHGLSALVPRTWSAAAGRAASRADDNASLSLGQEPTTPGGRAARA